MKINTETLSKALSIVKPGLAVKELIEQSTSFAFTEDGVVTYNDEISIRHPLPNISISGAIKAEELYLFLKKVKTEEIDIEITDNEIQFKAGRTKAGFTLQEKILLPLDTFKKTSKWHTLPEEFCHYLSLAMGAAGRDMSAPVLTCVHIQKDGTMVASDNYKVIKCNTGEEMPIDSFLLPATIAVDVVKIKPIKVASGKGWVYFKNIEGTVISCRIFEDKFPDPKNLLKARGIKMEFPSNMEEILDRASVFSKRGHILDEQIEITIANKKINISAKSETGWMSEKAKIDYDGEALDFAVTRYLLKDILKETTAFELSDKSLRFEGAGWVYVSALRNVK